MIVLYILPGLFLLLPGVLLMSTALQIHKARKLQGEHPVASPAQLDLCSQTLQEMLQCKTVSVKDSYDDTEFARLRDVVKRRFPLLHEKAEYHIFSQDCWVYKIPGKDENRNILLMSHHDVVAADGQWCCDPFGGEIKDGKIYGRGAADTKGSLCAILIAVEQLLKQGFQPSVNLFVASSHNEELGGDGIQEALAWFQSQNIRFEVILDEGGAIVDPPLGNMKCEKCAMVAVHEKGRCKLLFTAKAESSHVSLTGYKDNPVERMSAFIQEATTANIYRRRLNPQVRGMFSALAPYCGFPMNVLFCNLWLFGPLLLKVLPKINATAGGMIGTTCNFQTLQGSVNSKQCTAEAMLRNVNEEDLKAELERLKAIADKYGITVETTRLEYYPPVNTESPAYRYTMDCLKQVFPRFPAAPYILPAGTDAWRLSPVCDCVLRFAPTRMSREQLASIHARDENLDVSAVFEAAVFYRQFVEHYQ